MSKSVYQPIFDNFLLSTSLPFSNIPSFLFVSMGTSPVYAAREKNGIYIPRDRYLQEEAEKKAKSEKVKHMELDLEFRDKQLMEIQELYNFQQQLTAELSEKLEKTKKNLQETGNTLFDLGERNRKANATIREKEYLISNLLKSEKALVERALELRTELENATSDVSNLFTKIERKDKIEDGNRVIIQNFQSQLTQQLEILQKTVASSATQQEQKLQEMEEDMQSFVSTKSEVAEELRGQLSKLKIMYGSGIKVLNDLAAELDNNSQSTFGCLYSKVSKHSSALEELFRGIASEADTLFHDLQNSLDIQENKLSAYTQHQREAHAKTVATTRSISQINVNYFKTLDTHATELGQIVEEEQVVNDQQLSKLEKKFEECAANEEMKILEKVAELLAVSNARKKKLVQSAVDGLRDNAASRSNRLQQEMSVMQNSACSVKAEWTNFMEKAESHYLENTTSVERGKRDMEVVLQNCLEKAKFGVQQWCNAQESLLALEEGNVAYVDEIVRGGMETSQVLRAKISSATSSAFEDADIGSTNVLSSIERSLQLDREACGNLNLIIDPCCGNLRELKSGHYHKIAEIIENAGKCLSQEYTVDQPSCSTLTKREFNFPSVSSIEELRTSSFEELLKNFWDAKSSKRVNGNIRHILEAAYSLRDSRAPLTGLN